MTAMYWRIDEESHRGVLFLKTFQSGVKQNLKQLLKPVDEKDIANIIFPHNCAQERRLNRHNNFSRAKNKLAEWIESNI